jgi:hypothetical protein
MDTGVLALIGVFVAAALLVVWNARVRRRHLRQLETAGFVPARDPARTLEAFTGVARGHGAAARRVYELVTCYERPAGSGALSFLSVVDKTNADADRGAMGGAFDAYVVGLRDAERVVTRPASVYLLPKGHALARKLIEKLLAADAIGTQLEIGQGPLHAPFLAAFGDGPGSLDEFLPARTQERLVNAARAGFFAVHFGRRHAAFVAMPASRDVAAQLAHVGEWT